MSEKNGALSWRKRRAIPALLQTTDLAEVGAAVGVTERTIYRWLDQPEFQTALRQAEGEAIDKATRRLLILVDKALDNLEAILDDRHEKTDQKRLAAVAVLTHLTRLRDLRNIESRLERLERLVEERRPKARRGV